MRTTVTIDPDVEAMLDRLMKAKQLSFKEALNSALRAGLLAGQGKRAPAPVKVPVFQMKQRPGLNLDKAIQLAGELEDEELLRKMAVHK
jgi:hypothetical protein